MNIFSDELVYGRQNEKARIHITDNELLHLFNKTQDLDDDLKNRLLIPLMLFCSSKGLKSSWLDRSATAMLLVLTEYLHGGVNALQRNRGRYTISVFVEG